MKTKIKHLFVFTLFALLSFTACQNEETEVNNPTEQETIIPNSTLANLISYTTANFGAADDILDGASCFSVELPVTIIVSDVTITIENEDDLEQLEDVFEDLVDDEDFLDFVFPITIIFSDYTELVIENEDQLENFISECDEDEDDVIECIDFVYPISFSVFNSEFNLIDTIVIENDEALYDFLDDLEEDENALIVSLNYPVVLEYANSETIEVNTNQELADAIEAAGDDCEDDDDDDCVEDGVALNLVECPWEVFLYSNDDLDNLSGPYVFNFNEDGTMVLEGVLQDSYTTTWELSETDNGLELNIASFYYFEEQFGNWLVVECDDDDLEFEHLTVDGTGLFFEQECEDDLDCSIADISEILQECPWDFTDATGNFDNYQMVFNENGDLLIPEGIAGSAIGGTWNLSATDNGLILTFSELTAFQDTLGGDWLIIECDDDRLEIIKENLSLILEQDCESDLECSEDQIIVNIIECAWELQTNLIDSVVPIYVYFTPNGEVLSSNDDIPESQIGTWNLVIISGDIFIDFTLQQGLEVLNGQWQIVECEEDELYLVNGDNYIELEQDCDLENDDEVFDCFSDFEIVACNQPSNVPVFNLSANTIGLIDCPFPFTASFHATQVEAENNTNAIENTESYGTLSTQVYLRIESDSGNFEVFTIYLNTQDCADFDCFVDTEISACSENSDGFATFNLTEANADCGLFTIYGVYYFESLSDAQNNINAIANPESYSVSNDITPIYGAVINTDSNATEHTFSIALNIEDCNYFECFGDYDLAVCDEENGAQDDLGVFDLNLIFSNCPNDGVVYTFHNTLVDAQNDTNALPSPFTNTANPQTIYSRVSLAGNQNIYEIFSHNLIVEDCNTSDCSEQDVDAFLLECIWNAVNYNGSDSLMEWNFDFESTNQIVVIYTDSQTIDASWSTSQSSDGVIVEFSNIAGPNIQAITGEWLVVECEDARLELHRGDDILVLERDCN